MEGLERVRIFQRMGRQIATSAACVRAPASPKFAVWWRSHHSSHSPDRRRTQKPLRCCQQQNDKKRKDRDRCKYAANDKICRLLVNPKRKSGDNSPTVVPEAAQ